MRKMKIRNLAAGIAFLGFLLTLTELHGGPWAGTYLGAALFILGALAALRINNKEGSAKNGKQDQIHLRVYRRPAGRDDAA
ncbi:MAG: hypothetical protein IKC53_09360 [Lentisphaeria bacterium]|nr:hypothetical protein [Lentisphaeria bacterium]